ncbi:MAG TPA: transglutaminase domain-containing protein [Thermoanaerobaculia bacterium]|nr:transglutaminase domain-containing protein [Thermoanaerobaculia bacterium]
MKRKLALAALLLLAVGIVPARELSAAGSSLAERRFSFEYQTTVTVPPGAGKVEIWLPYAESDAYQEIVSAKVESTVPVEMTRDAKYGNSIVHLALDHPTTPEVAVTLRFEVLRRENVKKSFPAKRRAGLPAEVGRWLEPDRLVPLSERIKTLAAEVTQGKTDPLDQARAIYDYVVSTMKYDKSGSGWGNGDIYWACDAKRGNCTDFHALFIGLCRAVGIPAKFAIGFPLPTERGAGEIGGYHCWAEFYLADYGWVPVDTSEAAKHPEKREYFFGAHDENRVQFTIGRDLVLSPRQAGEPLNYFVYPYAEVDGKATTEVKRSFRFADAGAGSGSAPGGR